jgi:hypothetical protein
MIDPGYRTDLLRQHSRRLEAAARRAQALSPEPRPVSETSTKGLALARVRAVLSLATQR